MPVYQGSNSCTARREGVYVRRIRRKGVDTVYEAVALAYMVLRDLRRGKTYDNDSCREIRMTKELFRKRIRFIYTLSKFHGADKETRSIIKKLLAYILRHRRLPSKVKLPSGREVSTKSIVKKMVVRK